MIEADGPLLLAGVDDAFEPPRLVIQRRVAIVAFT